MRRVLPQTPNITVSGPTSAAGWGLEAFLVTPRPLSGRWLSLLCGELIAYFSEQKYVWRRTRDPGEIHELWWCQKIWNLQKIFGSRALVFFSCVSLLLCILYCSMSLSNLPSLPLSGLSFSFLCFLLGISFHTLCLRSTTEASVTEKSIQVIHKSKRICRLQVISTWSFSSRRFWTLNVKK